MTPAGRMRRPMLIVKERARKIACSRNGAKHRPGSPAACFARKRRGIPGFFAIRVGLRALEGAHFGGRRFIFTRLPPCPPAGPPDALRSRIAVP